MRASSVDIPVCASEYRHSTRDRISLAGIRLHSDTSGVLHAEQVVDDLKALIPLREINGGDVHDTLELALGVVPEESEDLNDGRWRDINRELVLEHGELLYEFGEALDEVRAELV